MVLLIGANREHTDTHASAQSSEPLTATTVSARTETQQRTPELIQQSFNNNHNRFKRAAGATIYFTFAGIISGLMVSAIGGPLLLALALVAVPATISFSITARIAKRNLAKALQDKDDYDKYLRSHGENTKK